MTSAMVTRFIFALLFIDHQFYSYSQHDHGSDLHPHDLTLCQYITTGRDGAPVTAQMRLLVENLNGTFSITTFNNNNTIDDLVISYDIQEM